MAWSRSRRALKHAGQSENRSRFQRSTNSRLRCPARACASSTLRSTSTKARRTKRSVREQRLHRPVAVSGGNQRHHGCAAAKRRVDRLEQPRVLFVRRHERRGDQEKHSNSHAAAGQPVGRVDEPIDGHPFVESLQRVRMDRFETHRDFELAGRPVTRTMDIERIQETIHASAGECRMRLDDHLRDSRNRSGHRFVVLLRYGARIEEAAGVVELDLPHRWLFAPQPFASSGDLRRDGAWRCVSRRRVAPQVAHHTPPRAFTTGQEDRGRPCHATISRALVLDDDVLIAPGIVLDASGPTREHEPVPRDLRSGVESCRGGRSGWHSPFVRLSPGRAPPYTRRL